MPTCYYLDLLGLDSVANVDLDIKTIKLEDEEINKIRNSVQLHGYVSKNNNGLLNDFLDEMLEMYVNYYILLDQLIKKYKVENKMLQLFPNTEKAKKIFDDLKEAINENDIVNIYLYRGCGQYFVYNENNNLKVELHPTEYGRIFPEHAFKLFYKHDIQSINEIHDKLYNIIDVFDTTKKTCKILNQSSTINFFLYMCGAGICLSTDKFVIKRFRNELFCKSKYVYLRFMEDIKDDKEDYEDYEYIEVTEKSSGYKIKYFAEIAECNDIEGYF